MSWTVDNPPQFYVGLSEDRVNDIEEALRKAHRAARYQGSYVQIWSDLHQVIAKVFPDGKIDATWVGSRYISSHNSLS